MLNDYLDELEDLGFEDFLTTYQTLEEATADITQKLDSSLSRAEEAGVPEALVKMLIADKQRALFLAKECFERNSKKSAKTTTKSRRPSTPRGKRPTGAAPKAKQPGTGRKRRQP